MFLIIRREKEGITFTEVYAIADFKAKNLNNIREIINSFYRKSGLARYSFMPEEGAFMINHTIPAYFSEKLYKCLFEIINKDIREIGKENYTIVEYIASPGKNNMEIRLPRKKRQEIENLKEKHKQTVSPPMSNMLITSIHVAANCIIEELHHNPSLGLNPLFLDYGFPMNIKRI